MSLDEFVEMEKNRLRVEPLDEFDKFITKQINSLNIDEIKKQITDILEHNEKRILLFEIPCIKTKWLGNKIIYNFSKSEIIGLIDTKYAQMLQIKLNTKKAIRAIEYKSKYANVHKDVILVYLMLT